PPLLFVLIALVANAEAQHFPPNADLLELIRTRVEEGRATGIVVGVLEADGTRRIQAFGTSGPGALPLDAETVFEIGSISKVFTGIILADMAAEGLLAIEDPLQDHVPDGVTVPSRSGQSIRLVDIAMHRSALPRLPDNMDPADPSNPYEDYTAEMMYDFLNSHELRRDVGSEYEYSNLAVGLLGHVLALRNGTDYEGLVRDRILNPLGMTNSGITLTPEMARHFAKGHDVSGNVAPYWDIPTLAGAGALRSNMNDMLNFIEANVGEATSPLEQSMRKSHHVRAAAGGDNSVGLNWHIRAVGEDRIVWHNGGTAGFRTFAGFDPDREIGAVVLTNSGKSADDIGFHLINNAVPLALPPAPRQEVVVDRGTMERYVGIYELTPAFRITVTLEDSGLAVQATSQPKFPVFAESETVFFLKVVEAQVEFVVEEGAVAALILHQNGASQRASKVDTLINNAVPLAPAPPLHKEVAVDRGTMERYVGIYELTPAFRITVTLEDTGLAIQATSQPKFPAFAESETVFFLKVVEAQVEFVVEEGAVVALILHQNGASQRASKVAH
ncbi:MAG: serine hydrolase, partial [Candidatus Latescibacteria bacterium]|nr:serine hydrolase [Candidatus Latescibacterota bacterium]